MSFILAFLILFSPFISQEDPILEPVNNLFKGMELGDSTLVRNAFMKDAKMSTVISDTEGVQVRHGDLDRFITYIGSPRDNQLVEPIWNIKVLQDGVFAQVWADYALYVDGKFSHCGVDAFQLAQLDGEWKIISITDTRRTENCVIPSEVKALHEK